MRGAMLRPVAIAAGGTGGHLFPAEALAAALAARGQRVALFTDARTAARLGPGFAGAETHVIPAEGLAGRGLARATRAVVALARGTVAARNVLARIGAAAVVGFGGYPSVPPLLAARTLPSRHRPALILHEQNAVLGRANRALARVADLLALSFAATAAVPSGVPTRVTGNPVRPAIAALAGFGYTPPEPAGRFRLLVLGGSLGARVFAELVPATLAALPVPIRSRLSLAIQARAEDVGRVEAALAAAGIEATVSTFFADLAERLAAAHLVVARAGASTVAELACSGRPAILVPLPGAIDDHQSANARALAEAGGALLLPQASLTAAALAATIASLATEPGRLAAMARAASGFGIADSAERLADAVLSLARTEALP
jgi:UDP-N-acetylglucosamine--N-acetylmuramyl-(pentapeptide) pyrophosphoryl-undecaprenol N-acetylglucosamine transferase